VNPDVSVVLPVHNEAGHLREELARIRAGFEGSGISYELIVVDDGSTDETPTILAGDDGLRIIRLDENRGSGTARRLGTHAARGPIVVWTDADLTYPDDQIPQLVKELEGHDQVVGARRNEAGTLRAFRVPAKWIIRRLAQMLTRTKIPDLNSGFRAFRRDVAVQYLHLLPRGFSCTTTMTMVFLANGYSIKYVPIDYAPRAGRSKFHWWADTRRYLTQVVRLVVGYEPLRFFLPLGVALVLLGTGKLTYDLVAHPWKVATNTLLIFFAAFQVLLIGLLADLIVARTKPTDPVPPAVR
jgi:glycosyltransferase involved in cell wall biosynthesis